MQYNDKANKNTFFKIVIIFAIVIGILSLYLIFVLWPQPKKAANTYTSDNYQTQAKLQPIIHAEFSLVDTQNSVFNSKSLKGNPYLIYFGFTFCPDVCPATLEKLSEVAKILDLYHINIPILFVTIDPKRDTIDVLSNYMTNFSDKITALSGTEEQIKQIASQFKVYYAVAPTSDANSSDYLIDHTVFVYLMDKDGNYMTHFGLTQTKEEIIEYIRLYVK